MRSLSATPKESSVLARTSALHLSVVVPAFQEAAGLRATLLAIRDAVRVTGLSFTVIVVDDGSTDGTWSILESVSGELPELEAIRLSRNFGKEAAICAGLDLVRGHACILLDADLQHPPSLIPEMVRRWRDEEWDIVEAVKMDRGPEPRWQRAIARAFYRVSGWLTGYELQDASDSSCSIVAWWRNGDGWASVPRSSEVSCRGSGFGERSCSLLCRLAVRENQGGR